MTVPYNVIEVFSSEEARFGGKPVADAIIDVLRGARIAARCIVSRGQAGYYENGEIASARLEVLSSNLPLKIEVILPAPELDHILPQITEVVADGIVVVEDMRVISHRSRYRLIPRQMLVRDIMASPAVSVTRDRPVADIVRLLLEADFNGVPVVDDENRPVGIITQGDLVRRAQMPLRLGLLGETDHGVVGEFYDRAAAIPAHEVMSSPARTVRDDQQVAQAVDLMRRHSLKRLPAVDAEGRLTGMLTRLDVLRTAVSLPKAEAAVPGVCYVDWEGIPRVRDCMGRETASVTPDTSIDQALRTLDERQVQRLAVVDEDNRLLGLLTDRDILAAIGHRPEGLLRGIIDRLPLPGKRRTAGAITLDTSAGEIMKSDLITVTDDATVEEALRLMVEHSLKRLPVLDENGRYQGMISRNALLRLSTAG